MNNSLDLFLIKHLKCCKKDAYGKLKYLNNSQKAKTLLSKSKNMGSIPICSKRRLVKGVSVSGKPAVSKTATGGSNPSTPVLGKSVKMVTC